MGGAEEACLRFLVGVGVDGDDRRRARDSSTLNDVEADATGAMTTTDSPGLTRARFSTDPAPVSTAQPIRHAVDSGISFGIETACPA